MDYRSIGGERHYHMRQRGRIDEKSPSASDRCQPRRAAKKNSPPFERNRFLVPQQSIHLHDGQTRESSFPPLPGWVSPHSQRISPLLAVVNELASGGSGRTIPAVPGLPSTGSSW